MTSVRWFCADLGSDCTVLNGTEHDEWRAEKDLKGSQFVLPGVQHKYLLGLRKTSKTPVSRADVPNEIQTGRVPNRRTKYCRYIKVLGITKVKSHVGMNLPVSSQNQILSTSV